MADSGASVFVVDKKGHAVPRSIRLGEMQGDKWVVLEGLRPGEKIVTNGVQKVMAGQPVRVAGRDRKSVVKGKSVSVRVDLGGGRIIKKKNKTYTKKRESKK